MKLKPILIIIGICLLAVIIVLSSSFRVVKAGSVQVVTQFGRVTDRILHPGLNIITPFIENTLTYNTQKIVYEATSAEKLRSSDANYKDYPVDTNTKDGQQINIFYTVRFSVDPKKVTWVAQNIGNENDLVEKIVKTDSRIWIRNIPREYTATQLYTGDILEIQIKIENQLKPSFENNGIIMDSVGIRELKFSDEYVKAIEEKQIQEVQVQTEKNILDQMKLKKEQKITDAEGRAREQELLRMSLTSEMVQKLWIDKWDGKLPSVMGGGQNLMDISKFVR